MNQYQELEELLEIWNTHQVKHRCWYTGGLDSGMAQCPSVYGYFDKFVESRLNSVDGHDLFEFLVDKPEVRISGQVSILSDFRSGLEKMGFPVETLSETSQGVHPPYAPYYRHETHAQRSTRAPVEPSNNEVAQESTKDAGIILEQILSTLNSIDKGIATLVEYTKSVPVVVSVEPVSPARTQHMRDRIKDYLK